MAKPTAAELAKLTERLDALTDDERDSVIDALEPHILKRWGISLEMLGKILAGAKPDEKKPDEKKPDRRWWEL